MTRYALVIGVSEYQSSSLSKLPKAATDAEEVAKVLETHGKFNVERLPQQWNKETKCWEVANKQVTNTEVIDKLKTLLWERAARSEVLIYFTGHGIRVFDELEKPQGFLAVSNCKFQLKEGKIVKHENGISLDIINRLISNEKCEISSLVMLLDCCHSGSLLENREIRKALTVFGSENDYYLIAGCRSFEKARVFKGAANSIFTGSLLKGLSMKSANPDGTVTTDLVFNVISSELKDSGQEPIRMGGGRSIDLVRYQQDRTSIKERFSNNDRSFELLHNKHQINIQKYRTEAQRILYEDYGDNKRQIHPISRQALDELRTKLKISQEDAELIETETRQYCLNYEDKLQKYKKLLVDTFQKKTTLDKQVMKKLKNYQRVLELDNETVSLVYSSFGNDLYKQGFHQEAVFIFNEAIRISPKISGAYVTLGTILYQQNKKTEAIKFLTEARNLYTEQGMVKQANQISEFLNQQSNTGDAIKNFISRFIF